MKNHGKRTTITSISTFLSLIWVIIKRKVSEGSGCYYVQIWVCKYKEQIDDLVETNLWEITESERNTVDDICCQTEDSDIRHVKVYSLQFPQQNQWLNSEVMDVIFNYVAATQSDTTSFSHIVMKLESSASLLES